MLFSMRLNKKYNVFQVVKTGLLTFLNFVHEYTCRLESGYLVFGNDDSGFLGNVFAQFFAASLDDKTTKSAEVNVFARS